MTSTSFEAPPDGGSMIRLTEILHRSVKLRQRPWRRWPRSSPPPNSPTSTKTSPTTAAEAGPCPRRRLPAAPVARRTRAADRRRAPARRR
ncbi:hypothetical protein GUY61_23500, partial [Streptomyces sp. GC420]|nr:hypothetical protein [Streptomyces sp. GC420]